jgi:iron(III) transport system ATP-binding protein
MSGLLIEGVSHAYDDVAVVRDVSVMAAPGQVVCLLGPSGCGKTTLLRVAAGLERLQQGRICIDDTVVADAAGGIHLPPERRGIGLMFQDYALFPHLTVRDNIRFGVGADTPERRAWIDQAIRGMDLDHHADSFPHTLSGGQQQRVALLRALAPNPKVLLLDEPFSGLDVSRRAQVRQQTLDTLRLAGVTALMVTHDPEEAMFMADRILVMNQGRVVQDGSPVETYFRPANAFVAGFFGPVNRLEGRVADGHVATALGSFAAGELPDGVNACVLIRPEGLRLTVSANGDFTVLSARSLGGASLVAFEIPGDAGTVIAEARVPGIFLPATGSRIQVGVGADAAYVFES